MANSIVGIVSFLFTMSLEDEFNKIKLSIDPDAEILFPKNDLKKTINKKFENAESPNELPDMLIRSDYTGLTHKMVKEGLQSNIFENVMPPADKNDMYHKDLTFLGAKPWVIVADHSIDKNIVSPSHWSDLLDSSLMNKIGIQGKDDKFCGTLMMYINERYGKEGLEALAKNIKNVWHFTGVIKSLGKGNSKAAPINVMPLANAMMIVNQEPIEIIWPEEGALATPIYMLVKKEKISALESYIKCITGEKFEKLLTRNHIYSVKNGLDKKLQYLSREYINSIESMENHKEYLNKVFRDSINPGAVYNVK
ncbi:MAG: ABC transporter substrate-binding protein [Bacillota bacterium]|nr:ABC transporter substrate-binding protein [Bacillota bacterium]